jgi:hypothetical protein
MPARTGEITLGPWFEKHIVLNRLDVWDEDQVAVKRARYPWFLGFALLVLGFDLVLVRELPTRR